MKAFIGFVLVLLLAIGGLGGYWAWGRMNRAEDWGVGLELSSELKEGEVEVVETRYNQILDQDAVLANSVEVHDLKKFYGVSSNEKAVEKLREDTFVRIPNGQSMHILFRGKRKTRKERTAVTETLSKDFFKRVQEMSGR